MTNHLNIQFIDSIHDCPKDAWQTLLAQANIRYPFIQFNYLAALEDSGSCTISQGWQTKHCLIYESDLLVGLMPCYEKHHSYGEYVFDQQWAQAFQQHGLPYYPKLVTAIPFTPCAGPRLVLAQHLDISTVQVAVIRAIQDLCTKQRYSGWHYLFPQSQQIISELPCREGIQFHWYNRQYHSFDDFLARFTSRKRKAILKERRKVSEQGFVIKQLHGEQACDEDWQRFYHFYQLTYAKRSGHGGYLSEDFFQRIAATFSKHCLLIFAELNEKIVAGALYFLDDKNLYGRYWGCYEEYDFLHFE
ncbi:MAG: GNAT family N-acetyltransferase, partial [Sinobacterium sp.]|nr:GNAT family N-acetyltransferase [Sinobacterium sp.]